MKKKMILLMSGLALGVFTATQTLAFDIAGDMAEGLSLDISQDNARYSYDSRNAGVKESMTEYDFFPESGIDSIDYAGDPTCPSMQNLMAEGICMDTLKNSLAAK